MYQLVQPGIKKKESSQKEEMKNDLFFQNFGSVSFCFLLD